MATVPERTKVFISYSHKDKKHLDRLHVHLAPYERDGLVESWDDTKILPGAYWRKQIEIAIESAKVAILLVSADFLASKFITENELPRLLAAAKQEGATILPVILSPCGFDETSLSQFEALNPPTNPLSKMNRNDKEATWLRVAQVVSNRIISLKQLTDEDLSKAKADTDKTMSSEPKAVEEDTLSQTKPLSKMNRHEKEATGVKEAQLISNTTMSPKQFITSDDDMVKRDTSITLPSESNDKSTQSIHVAHAQPTIKTIVQPPSIIQKINRKIDDFIEKNAIIFVGLLVLVLGALVSLISLQFGNAIFTTVGIAATALGLVIILFTMWITRK